tara:strand:+ start:51 stop:428 length:378 start_codon:yes stop_codon:yes gene_type:complete
MINLFSKYKFIFYLSNLILILLYLFPGSLLGWLISKDFSSQPQLSPDFIISTNHLYSFLILSIIGFLTYLKSNYVLILSSYLIFLSLILEIMHYFIPERSFEISDLFGNLMGVVIVIIVNYFLKK